MESKENRTLILGASPNPARYANMAAELLTSKEHNIVQLGKRQGQVAGDEIHTTAEMFDNIDTVTLYLGPQNQVEYYQYIVSLKPRRVIFNPGTENPELRNLLEKNNIECINACTLVMLNMGTY
jgi:predicted CoA-binding protein